MTTEDTQQIPADAPNTPPTINSDRQPNDVEIFQRTEEFAAGLLQAVPELEAVAVVPVWRVRPENTPPALLRFRAPMETALSGILQLLQSLTQFCQMLNRELTGQYQMLDNNARGLEQRIEELKHAVAENEAAITGSAAKE
jgi:hypothetical protein